MSEEQKGALTTWLQALVGVAALFIPGLTDAMQLGILGLGAASLTLLALYLPKEDPMKQFETARARLELERGIRMPTIDQAIQKGQVEQVPARTRAPMPRRRNTPPRDGDDAA
jgi:hypothetical protein